MGTPTTTNGHLLGAIVLFVMLAHLSTGIVTTVARAEGAAEVVIVSADTHTLPPLDISLPANSRHQPDPRLPALTQHLPTFAAPNMAVTQQIILHNDEAHTRTVTVTQQLPDGLEPATNIDWNPPEDIQWRPSQRRWTWTGELMGGNRDYVIEPTSTNVPYLDLATYGVENLCEQFAETDEHEVTTVACDEATVTLNIGRIRPPTFSSPALSLSRFGRYSPLHLRPQIFSWRHHPTPILDSKRQTLPRRKRAYPDNCPSLFRSLTPPTPKAATQIKKPLAHKQSGQTA